MVRKPSVLRVWGPAWPQWGCAKTPFFGNQLGIHISSLHQSCFIKAGAASDV